MAVTFSSPIVDIPSVGGVARAADALDDVGQIRVPLAQRDGTRLFNSFDDFAKGRDFFDDLGRFDSTQAQKAWEVYQRTSRSKGLLIGGRNDVANAFADGWDKLGTLNWSPEINRAWLDGAIDAGLPVRLVTPANVLHKLEWTRWEIGYLLSRGYVIRGGVFVPK